ncbi:MAG: 3-oxoacyl-[acyl-carrier-protein] synthase III C-terminal domain-containing protein [Candidatus Binatus sp.]|uniref:type III polyketide synthase n=1 Tax=Candidatus Binatus sp. TaxID=2811406 RepID=UPI002719BF2F|nr:3-oxoacyl-[acyl-carrier-protein] synthase III C-terminal domain-containing protein [Candidatus Binatus sp.]MDO8430915.1 3-oxoacyl-[acyl-carrier-protein] synthase III C-terminal domain-containing protein [Candidatus Binatus sp.]
MKIASVSSSFPATRYHQSTVTEAFRNYWGKRLENPELFERIHSRTGVQYRHFALPIPEYEQLQNFGRSNRAWMQVAQELGEQALDRALIASGVERSDLDALFVVSVTGIASPSLDARLINRMRLRNDLKRTPIFGLGCVAGATGLTRAADYVRAYPNQTAALLSVELCSLTMQLDDLTMPNFIATGLFGDGAAAAIVVGSERASDRQSGGPTILATRSVFYPDTEEIMGWDITEKGFKLVLSAELSDLIRARLLQDVDGFLGDHGLRRGDIGNWVIHTGGPKILQAIQETLELDDRALELSWDSLARFGNLSSASILLVLEDTISRRRPAAGTLGLMLAMGPGFCSELLLVRW